MNIAGILKERLNRHFTGGNYNKSIKDLAHYMVAIQAQDYTAAKWAIGLRLADCNAVEIDNALAKAEIIRTHVLRPTWHFIAPEDAYWLLSLSARRINMACATNNKKLELDNKVFNKCNTVLENTLTGTELTRQELATALNKAGISTNDLRLVHILMRAETDKVICSGGRLGKQFTYALLSERTAHIKHHTPDEPISELALRYFNSHGPASEEDFAWWSGLTLTETRLGIESMKSLLIKETIKNRVLWYGHESQHHKHSGTCLLPAFDEYTVAYKDRSDFLSAHHADLAKNGIFNPVIIVNGKIAGTWQRTVKKSGPEIHLQLFESVSATAMKDIQKSIDAYIAFFKEK